MKISLSHYSPFGSCIQELQYAFADAGDTSKYRFGFNTQERDDEIAGEGNLFSAEFWEYDGRLGRRWNVDPVPQENVSDYACLINNPVFYIDIKGDKSYSTHLDPNGKVIAVYNDGDKSVYKHQTAKTKANVDYWRKHFNNTSGNGIKIGETLRIEDFFVTNDKTGGYDMGKVPDITIDVKNLTITGKITPNPNKTEKIYNADAQRLLDWGLEIFQAEMSNNSPDFVSNLLLLKKMSANYNPKTASTGAGCLDFKSSLGLKPYTPIKAGTLSNGMPVITTLRAMGNMTFGQNILITKPLLISKDFYFGQVMQQVGEYNQKQNSGNGYNKGYPFYGEHSYSGNYIYYGYHGKFYK